MTLIRFTLPRQSREESAQATAGEAALEELDGAVALISHGVALLSALATRGWGSLAEERDAAGARLTELYAAWERLGEELSAAV